MPQLTHIGQYWSSRHREVRLLGCADVDVDDGGGCAAPYLQGRGFDLSSSLPLPGHRRFFRETRWGEVGGGGSGVSWAAARWTYSALPFPAVELVEQAEAMSQSIPEFLEQAGDVSSVDLATLDVPPQADVDHLVAPIIPRRAQGFGVTYLNSALERQSEGKRADYAYVYRAVKERGERPELFLKGTAAEHFVGPRGFMGLRRDLTNSETLDGKPTERVPLAAGIEPELAAVTYSGGGIWGYTLANDVSGNHLENETLLYLAQAKHFTGALVLGPLIWLSSEQANPGLDITVRILAEDGAVLFEHTTNTSRINAPLETLVGWAKSHIDLQPGEVFSTGTDCVPDGSLKVLSPGQRVEIQAPRIGVLRHGAATIPEGGELNLNYSRLELGAGRQ